MQITLHEHLSWVDTSTKKCNRYFWKMILVSSQTPLTTQKSEFTTVGSCLQILTMLTRVQGYSTVKAILSGLTPSSICCWSIVFVRAYKMGLSFCSVKKQTNKQKNTSIYIQQYLSLTKPGEGRTQRLHRVLSDELSESRKDAGQGEGLTMKTWTHWKQGPLVALNCMVLSHLAELRKSS